MEKMRDRGIVIGEKSCAVQPSADGRRDVAAEQRRWIQSPVRRDRAVVVPLESDTASGTWHRRQID